MKATALMIGDWILCSDNIQRQVRYLQVRPSVIGIGGSSYDEDEIQPIPLTPEILEKNGFVKYNEVSDTPPYDQDEEGNMYYSYKGEHKFWGWWQPNNVYFIPVNAMIDLEIKYVHELQHALRLCGINKEIEI